MLMELPCIVKSFLAGLVVVKLFCYVTLLSNSNNCRYVMFNSGCTQVTYVVGFQ